MPVPEEFGAHIYFSPQSGGFRCLHHAQLHQMSADIGAPSSSRVGSAQSKPDKFVAPAAGPESSLNRRALRRPPCSGTGLNDWGCNGYSTPKPSEANRASECAKD